jgi:putative transposase
MKAYSLDLRTKIVEAWNNGEGTVKELAERFKVSRSTVDSYIYLWRTTGQLEPSKTKRGTKNLITEEHRTLIEGFLEQNNDALLTELCELFQQSTGIEVHPSTMSRTLKRFGITRKKNSSSE